MAMNCTVCAHEKRREIDRLLTAGQGSNRRIATQYSVTEAAIRRHKAEHLPETLVRAEEAKEEAHAADLMAELTRCFVRVNKLFDACDEWLMDSDNPERYDIGPRA